MRIIGGINRGRKLKAPDGLSTRPTLDKVRSAVFNVLFDVTGKSVLDMFGGSGAMTLEALSRGASSGVIIDNDRKAFAVIKENVKSLGAEAQTDLRNGDFRKCVRFGEQFDLIFLDPPYFEHLMEDALDLIDRNQLLTDNGIVVCETDASCVPDYTAFGFECIKSKRYGQTQVLFLKIN